MRGNIQPLKDCCDRIKGGVSTADVEGDRQSAPTVAGAFSVRRVSEVIAGSPMIELLKQGFGDNDFTRIIDELQNLQPVESIGSHWVYRGATDENA